MLKIAITGGIGSGKSLVSDIFSNWGSYIFDADGSLLIIICRIRNHIIKGANHLQYKFK